MYCKCAANLWPSQSSQPSLLAWSINYGYLKSCLWQFEVVMDFYVKKSPISAIPFEKQVLYGLWLPSNEARISKRIGSLGWIAIWSRSFKARRGRWTGWLRLKIFLTCYLLRWMELKCTFRLFIQTLKHKLAAFASGEGLKRLMMCFCGRTQWSPTGGSRRVLGTRF